MAKVEECVDKDSPEDCCKMNEWDISTVDDLSFVFHENPLDQDLNSWDTSRVTNMKVRPPRPAAQAGWACPVNPLWFLPALLKSSNRSAIAQGSRPNLPIGQVGSWSETRT